MPITALDLLCAAIAAWLAIGAAGLAIANRVRLISRVLFPAGALVGVLIALVAFTAIAAPAQTRILPFGLPDLPFHLRVDALSAFFLLLLGATSAAVSVYSAGYFRAGEGASPGLLCFQYHAFLAAMALVLVADDAYAFMVAWEAMALASFFLVTTDHRIAEIRRAGYLYLLIAHIGAIAILLAFGTLKGGGDYTFASMRTAGLDAGWASVAFFLALTGFGAKAGVMPLHVWLPEAHPAAPSPVSALMSGVMLKTAIYGLLRVTFDLLSLQLWWWGVVALALGLATALFGVIFAAVQTDMKRLLAWSSIENIGILVAGIGLAVLFKAYGKPALAAIAMTAVLYHALNHALMKSLLFLATGSVLHATHERSLGRLGGLARRMPWVASLALVGVLAIAALPPLNGFVSEWLLIQAFLFTPSNLMSNDHVGATLIEDERDVYYDAGVRLKSSQRGRPETLRVGFALRFSPDRLFRGSYDSVLIDRSEGVGYGQREMLIEQVMNHAGSVPASYSISTCSGRVRISFIPATKLSSVAVYTSASAPGVDVPSTQ